VFCCRRTLESGVVSDTHCSLVHWTSRGGWANRAPTGVDACLHCFKGCCPSVL
jgi:hypothetical protein